MSDKIGQLEQQLQYHETRAQEIRTLLTMIGETLGEKPASANGTAPRKNRRLRNVTLGDYKSRRGKFGYSLIAARYFKDHAGPVTVADLVAAGIPSSRAVSSALNNLKRKGAVKVLGRGVWQRASK